MNDEENEHLTGLSPIDFAPVYPWSRWPRTGKTHWAFKIAATIFVLTILGGIVVGALVLLGLLK